MKWRNKWLSIKGWLKTNWLLVIAILVGASVFIFTWKRLPSPNGGSARYLLSAMPQVIGTVFVITIAVMQLVGIRKAREMVKLLSRGYFIVTAITSFFGIALPLVALYLNRFYVMTALCLGLGVGNLLIIGWFIIRTVYTKAILLEELEEIPERETPEQELRGKSLIDLKRRAVESIKLEISSNACEVIDELMKRAKKSFIEGEEGKIVTRDVCSIIVKIAYAPGTTFPEVWEKSTDALIQLDRLVREQNDLNFSRSTTMFYLMHLASRLIYIPSREGELPPWLKLKDYTLESLREDLTSGQVNFMRILPVHKFKEIDGLGAVILLLRRLAIKREFEEWEKFQQPIIDELIQAMRNSQLRKQYEPQAFSLGFSILAQRPLAEGRSYEERDFNQFYFYVQEFATTVDKKPSDLMNEETRSLVISSNFIADVNWGGLASAFDNIRKRFEEEKS